MRKPKAAWKKILKDKSGTSIVSVMAAFVILLVSLSMVSTATLSAMKVAARSSELRKELEHCMEARYLGDAGEGEIEEISHETSFTLTDDKTAGLTAQIPGKMTEFHYNFTDMDGNAQTFLLYCFSNIQKGSGEEAE